MLSDNLYLGRCQIAMLCSVELNHKEKEEVDDLYRRVETLLGKKAELDNQELLYVEYHVLSCLANEMDAAIAQTPVLSESQKEDFRKRFVNCTDRISELEGNPR